MSQNDINYLWAKFKEKQGEAARLRSALHRARKLLEVYELQFNGGEFHDLEIDSALEASITYAVPPHKCGGTTP